MKYLRKPLSAFLSFVLTCNLCPVLPAHARAAETPFAMSTDVPEEGEAASGQSTDETAYGDTTDEEVESGRWQALQELIVRSEDGATITLVSYVVYNITATARPGPYPRGPRAPARARRGEGGHLHGGRKQSILGVQ